MRTSPVLFSAATLAASLLTFSCGDETTGTNDAPATLGSPTGVGTPATGAPAAQQGTAPGGAVTPAPGGGTPAPQTGTPVVSPQPTVPPTTPETQTPGVTTPETPTPDVTTPETPTPDVTTPETPTPDVTTPETPTPDTTPDTQMPDEMPDMAMGGMPGDVVEEPDPTPVGDGTRSEGPCDIYGGAGNECVAAYSTIRALKMDYDGPLYQVRSGSNAQNTGMGGELHDIGQTADGFADAAAQDAVCGGTLCTIAKLYDQSGRGNDLTVAKRGLSNGGEFADDDDFESIADDGAITVGGHQVYSLYMEARQGYRMTVKGDGMPRGREAQGMYMLADGTHVGNACCWDFGNVTETPTQYHTMNTLFFGTAYWGRGAGSGPWFGADFEAGVWMGGSNAGDPGWGELETAQNAPANDKNPSLRVPYALGFLKTDTNYALRMADLETANELTTAYEGPLPKPMDNQGAVVIGVGGDNSNNSWGTFYEGVIVLGYPSADTEQAVMQNIKAAGYGQ